jgi:hypothetical protein
MELAYIAVSFRGLMKRIFKYTLKDTQKTEQDLKMYDGSEIIHVDLQTQVGGRDTICFWALADDGNNSVIRTFVVRPT